ncbi:MAG: glycosyltransferase family 1 protein [Candidatus Saccharimonadales bacterium]
MSGNVFVDVTQLHGWQGKLTGIPRVMSELSSRFSTSEGYKLVVWQHKSGFVELSYDDLLADRQKVQQTVVQPAGTKSIRKTILDTVPGARKSIHYARQLKQRRLRAEERVFQDSRLVTSHDTLVILWGAWESQPYIDYVAGLHESGTKLVQVVYDMLPLVTPQFSGHSTEWLMNYASTLYPLCSLLLSISEHTSKDTRAWLETRGLRVPEIRTFRLGDDFKVAKPKRTSDPSFVAAKLKGSDYLLAVGTVEARKNHALLYYSYKLAAQRKLDLPSLVIVGRRGWLTDDIYTLMTTDPEVKEKFVFLQNAGDEELAWLYKNCLFSVYPSFYEGWGLPVAESIAHGVPCLASNTSSIPEIGGDLIGYFSPYSTDECLDALCSLLDTKKLAAARQKVRQYRPMSWEQTYKTFDDHLRSVR